MQAALSKDAEFGVWQKFSLPSFQVLRGQTHSLTTVPARLLLPDIAKLAFASTPKPSEIKLTKPIRALAFERTAVLPCWHSKGDNTDAHCNEIKHAAQAQMLRLNLDEEQAPPTLWPTALECTGLRYVEHSKPLRAAIACCC
jgi:hypothetical protein